MSELKIGIILGSTRPGRNGKAVADWVLGKAHTRLGGGAGMRNTTSLLLDRLAALNIGGRGRRQGTWPGLWSGRCA